MSETIIVAIIGFAGTVFGTLISGAVQLAVAKKHLPRLTLIGSLGGLVIGVVLGVIFVLGTQRANTSLLSGEWDGTLTLGSDRFSYHLSLTQHGNLIDGTSRSANINDSQNYAEAQVQGQQLSSDEVQIEEVAIIADYPLGTGCLISGDLHYSTTGSTASLNGPSGGGTSSSGCARSGTLILHKQI